MTTMTANIPTVYLEAMDDLIGDEGLYPNRSELIRVAVRKFLLKELEHVKEIEKEGEFDSKKYVRVPMETIDPVTKETIRTSQTFRIIRKLT